MTDREVKADDCLLDAKAKVKTAFTVLDPSVQEPLAQSLLRVLDSIDDARLKLKNRLPASGNPAGVAEP